MIKNKSIKDSMMRVETAENLEQLKEAIVDVFRAIDEEIMWINDSIGER